MLDFTLVENPLTPTSNDYIAQPVAVRSYNQNEIIERILKIGAGLTKSDIVSVLAAYEQVICDIVEEGSAVTTNLFKTKLSIAGVFNNSTDNFDPKRHRVKVNLSKGIVLRNASAKVKTQKVQVAEPIPSVLEVKDTISGCINERLTAGGVIQITGTRLKLFSPNITNGVFLVSEQGDPIQLTIIENKPARLLVMLPVSLPYNKHYTLEVRTSYLRNGKEAKNLKVGIFHKSLPVLSQESQALK